MPKAYSVKIPSTWPRPTSAEVRRWLQDFFARGSVNSIGPDPGAGDYVLRLSLPERAVSKLSDSLGDAPATALRRLVAHYQRALPGPPRYALSSPQRQVVLSRSVAYAEPRPRGCFNPTTGLWHGTGTLFAFREEAEPRELPIVPVGRPSWMGLAGGSRAPVYAQPLQIELRHLENPYAEGFLMSEANAESGFFAQHPVFTLGLIVAGIVIVVWAYRKWAAPARGAAAAATVPAKMFHAWKPLP